MAPSGASRPIRQSRTKVQTYYEETSSDEEENRSEGTAQNELRRVLRSRGQARVKQSHREVAAEAGDIDPLNDDDTDSHDAPTTTANRSKHVLAPEAATLSPQPPQHAKTAPAQPKPAKSPAAKTAGTNPNKKAKLDVADQVAVGPGTISPWQNLPYHVWFDIFLRASYPLMEENGTRTPSVQWLARAAVTCRALMEPALAALYHSPPLLPALKTHRLLDLLSEPQNSLSINYAAKVKELYVEAEKLLLLKGGPTVGYFSLSELVSKTPRLRVLRLYHQDDFTIGIPFWNIPPSRFDYPESLFTVLDQRPIFLRSWDWNGRFLNRFNFTGFMLDKHKSPAFQRLKELRLLHLDSDLGDDVHGRQAALAATIKALPEIERLELVECTLVGDTFLHLLPTTLRALVICDCDMLHPVSFMPFLKYHGHHLRELTLCNNRHLNLSFMMKLATHCPHLEKFKVDIQIHDMSAMPDLEPHFAQLLHVAEIPTWPSSLQEIELSHLRRWDMATAEMFFKSLVNAGPQMPHLRRLTLSAILKIGWRDRAAFREKWISRIEKVFLRHSAPPDSSRCLPERPVSSITEPTSGPVGPSTAPPTLSKRHSRRLATRNSSDLEDNAESSESYVADLDEEKIQGMCDVVNICIGNLRPSEVQYHEDDFLDDELSGDDDWEGEDFEPGDTFAW